MRTRSRPPRYLSARGPQRDSTLSRAGPAPSVAGSAQRKTIGQACHNGSCCLALPCMAPQADGFNPPVSCPLLPQRPQRAATRTSRGKRQRYNEDSDGEDDIEEESGEPCGVGWRGVLGGRALLHEASRRMQLAG